MWSGNLAAGSSMSDILIPFLAAACKLELMNAENKTRWVTVDQKLFCDETGKKRLQIGPDEIISKCLIPTTGKVKVTVFQA